MAVIIYAQPLIILINHVLNFSFTPSLAYKDLVSLGRNSCSWFCFFSCILPNLSALQIFEIHPTTLSVKRVVYFFFMDYDIFKIKKKLNKKIGPVDNRTSTD